MRDLFRKRPMWRPTPELKDHYDVVIVGGGLEGIEALGEILRRFRHREAFDVIVVEAGARLLPGTPSALPNPGGRS